MKRTQVYLDEELWNALHVKARSKGTSVSALVRQAVREQHLGEMKERRESMQAIVRTRKDRSNTDSVSHVRSLRRGRRLFGFMAGEFRIVGDIESPPDPRK